MNKQPELILDARCQIAGDETGSVHINFSNDNQLTNK
jgi:hypothetical protein